MPSSTARGVQNPSKASHSWFLMPCLVLTCRNFWASACAGARQGFILLPLPWCCADSQWAEPGTQLQAEKFSWALCGLHMAQSACRGKIPNTASSGRTSDDFNASNHLFWARPSSLCWRGCMSFCSSLCSVTDFLLCLRRISSRTEFISFCKLR